MNWKVAFYSAFFMTALVAILDVGELAIWLLVAFYCLQLALVLVGEYFEGVKK